MLVVSTRSADQRVVSFLLDLSARLRTLGLSGNSMLLRMSRADLGNFLSLRLETVVRALYHLQAQGLISVERRKIRILDAVGLRALLSQEPALH